MAAEPTAPAAPRLATAAASSLGALAGQKVAMAVAGVATARLLGPAGKGSLAVLLLIATAVASVASGGLELWITRSIPRGQSGVRSVVRQQAIAGAAIAVVTAAMIGVIGRSTWGITSTDAVILGLLAGSSVVFLLVVAVPLGLGRMRRWALGFLLDGVTFALAIFALIAADKADLKLVLVGAIAGKLVGIVIAVGAFRALDNERAGWGATREALRFGLPAGVGNLLTFATYRLDVLLIIIVASPTDVGLYVAASAIAEVLWLPADAAVQVLVPHVARHGGREDTTRLSRICTTAVVLGGVVLLLAGPVLLRTVFGADFRHAADALPPLLAASLALSVWKILVADLAARGETARRASSAALGVAVMLLLDVGLVPRFGIRGAGLGAFGGYTAAACLAFAKWRRMTGGCFSELVLSRGADFRVARSAVARLARG